jgi:RND family efflux transporter MFP subunit
MNVSKRMLVIGVIAVIVLCVVWAVRDTTGKRAANNTSQNQPSSAAVAVVQREPAESSITVPGVFQAYQDILVHAKVSGYVKKIYVDIGDRVHTGEILAVLEVPELNAQVQEAAAGLSRDRSELERSKNDEARAVAVHSALHSEYTRLKNAADAQSGLIAQQELDDAQAKDLSSEARIDAAKSEYAAAEGRLSQDRADVARYEAMQSYSEVRAPFNGVVTYRYADTGALIAAGTDETKSAMPIVRLAQSEVLRLRMPIPASDANYMKIGGPAVVQVQSTGETIHTKIVRFTRSLDQNTRTMLTEVDIPNADLHLDPGMYANTTFPLKRDRDAMVVPIDGIVEGDQPYVLVVNEQNRVVKQPVVLGIQGANFYEVVSGVQIGDRVIVGDQSDYQPGEKVSPSPVDMNLTTFRQTSAQRQGAPIAGTSQPSGQEENGAGGQK